MSKESRKQQDNDPKAQAAGPDLEAEHSPDTSRRASNAGLQAEVQKKLKKDGAGGPANAQAAAAKGVKSPTTTMPHQERLQQAFGPQHDLSGVQAHVGGDGSAEEMGAQAYATGNHVVFGAEPDLHTAAHEAAHVVQQRGGVQLKGGVGQAGDAHEQNADAVADRVVAGKSATDLLGGPTNSAGPAGGAVQKKGPATPAELHTESDDKTTDAAKDALMMTAHKMHAAREAIQKELEHPPGEGANGPTIERLQKHYDYILGAVNHVDAVANSGVNSTDRQEMRFGLEAIKGAWGLLQPVMKDGLDYLDAHQSLGVGRAIQHLDQPVAALLKRSGFDVDALHVDKADPKVDPKAPKGETLEGLVIKDNMIAAEAALASLKAGNQADGKRIAHHLLEIVTATNNLPAPMASFKGQLLALDKEIVALQPSNQAISDSLMIARTHIQTLLKLTK